MKHNLETLKKAIFLESFKEIRRELEGFEKSLVELFDTSFIEKEVERVKKSANRRSWDNDKDLGDIRYYTVYLEKFLFAKAVYEEKLKEILGK